MPAIMPAIGAGALDRQVAIEKPTTASRSDSGQKQVTWVEIARVWANRQDLRGRERFLAEQTASHITTRWIMHYRADVTPEKRIRDIGDPVLADGALGRLYDISAALEVGGRQRWLEVLATARSEIAED